MMSAASGAQPYHLVRTQLSWGRRGRDGRRTDAA